MDAGFGPLVAFIIGAMGSIHCIGMCGGIVGALGRALPEARRRDRGRRLACLLAYNAGRIATYTLIGAAAGVAGSGAFALLDPQPALGLGRMLAGAFMIAFGLYLAGWWRGLAALERRGQWIWRRLEPLGRRFLPVRHLRHALAVGAVWGWLPCGLVYSALAWAFVAGGGARGALLMLAFGLGTLPVLLLMGMAGGRLLRAARAVWVGRLIGSAVILLGAAHFTL